MEKEHWTCSVVILARLYSAAVEPETFQARVRASQGSAAGILRHLRSIAAAVGNVCM